MRRKVAVLLALGVLLALLLWASAPAPVSGGGHFVARSLGCTQPPTPPLQVQPARALPTMPILPHDPEGDEVPVPVSTAPGARTQPATMLSPANPFAQARGASRLILLAPDWFAGPRGEDAPRSPRLSPDGRRVVVEQGGGLWVASEAEDPLILAPRAGELWRDAHWFSSERLLIVRARGQQSRLFSWSPGTPPTPWPARGGVDGALRDPEAHQGQVAFVGPTGLYLRDAVGQVRMLVGGSDLYDPALAGDGSRVAYTRGRRGQAVVEVITTRGDDRLGLGPLWGARPVFVAGELLALSAGRSADLLRVDAGGAELLATDLQPPTRGSVAAAGGWVAFVSRATPDRITLIHPGRGEVLDVLPEVSAVRDPSLVEVGDQLVLAWVEVGEGRVAVAQLHP